MNVPLKETYLMATVTEALLQLLCTRQRDKEDVLEYIKRFKQGWQIMRSHMGDEFLHHFIHNSAEYKELLNTHSEAKTDTALALASHALCLHYTK